MCLEHGDGQGFAQIDFPELAYVSPSCRACDVVYCKAHFERMTTSDSCYLKAWAEYTMSCGGAADELLHAYFCPAHHTVRCDLRYSSSIELSE